MRARTRQPGRGFTLMELLVCVAVVATLLGLLLPSLAGARESGRSTVCGSNLRQLVACAHAYAHDFKGAAPPGAASILGNLHRWHGSRSNTGQVFQSEGGSLSSYLGAASTPVRACPTFASVLDDPALGSGPSAGFERGCGGYGYNNAYLGTARASQPALGWTGCKPYRIVTDRAGSAVARFQAPALTVAFSDTAFADAAAPRGVIEYSFSEPRLWPEAGTIAARADPSMHFRHHAGAGRSGVALVAWLDGHVSDERRTFTWASGLYELPELDALTGWTGRDDDNALYDYD